MDSTPTVVAHCGAEIAAWIDPVGTLRAAGLLVVAHVGDAPQETQPRASGEDKTMKTETLTKSTRAARFLSDDLREALATADAVEALITLPLIERAATMARDLDALRCAIESREAGQ